MFHAASLLDVKKIDSEVLIERVIKKTNFFQEIKIISSIRQLKALNVSEFFYLGFFYFAIIKINKTKNTKKIEKNLPFNEMQSDGLKWERCSYQGLLKMGEKEAFSFTLNYSLLEKVNFLNGCSGFVGNSY